MCQMCKKTVFKNTSGSKTPVMDAIHGVGWYGRLHAEMGKVEEVWDAARPKPSKTRFVLLCRNGKAVREPVMVTPTAIQPPDSVLEARGCTCQTGGSTWPAENCPYKEEISGELSPCTCCDYCRHQCAMDI